MGTERVVLCGGIVPPSGKAASEAALKRDLWGTVGEKNVRLKIADIHGRLGDSIPPRFHDLIEIAAYVYAADQGVTRGGADVDGFGGGWRRSFQFHIPVRELDFWNDGAVKSLLYKTLKFLSDDYYEFLFYEATNAPGFQTYLKLTGNDASKAPEQVVLFSGGLDSLAGVVQEVIGEKRRVMLVNHRPTEKHNRKLRALQTMLATRSSGLRPEHLAVRVNKAKELPDAIRSRVSRGFVQS